MAVFSTGNQDMYLLTQHNKQQQRLLLEPFVVWILFKQLLPSPKSQTFTVKTNICLPLWLEWKWTCSLSRKAMSSQYFFFNIFSKCTKKESFQKKYSLFLCLVRKKKAKLHYFILHACINCNTLFPISIISLNT